MSIKYGIVETKSQITNPSSTFNLLTDTTNKNQKLSLAFKHTSQCYSLSNNLDKGAEYPRSFEFHSLNRKNYRYSLRVLDAKTKEVISPLDLDYEVLYVKDSLNYTVTKDSIFFNLDFNNIPKEEIRATLRIKGNSYLMTYVQIEAVKAANEQIHDIYIVNIDNLPDGVSIVNTTIEQNSSGTVQENILNFPSSSTKYESSTMTIPQGTKFYDANHDLLEGDIHIKIGHFSPTTARDLFSPGWGVSNIEYDNQIVNNVNFISGGFWSVDIFDDSGRSAKTIY